MEGTVSMTSELDKLFNPRSVVVIGASASPLKIGTATLFSLIVGGFKGKVYPVNPKGGRILGLNAYSSVKEIPDSIDLAIICVPAVSVPQVVQECIEAGIKLGVVITSGFAEVSEEGKKLQQEATRIAREGGVRIVGPNCMGVASSSSDFYALMNLAIPKKGSVSMVSQSGTLGTLITMLASAQGVGFSKFVSSGNEADLHLEDLVEYLADDPETKVIALFIEGIRDGGKFFRVAKEATKRKPIIALKGGRSELGAKAASSHTGAIVGSSVVYDAMFKQAGIIQAQDDEDMVDLLKAFSFLSPPEGRKVGFISPAGGYGVLVSDACARERLELPQLSAGTIQKLDRILPLFWSHRNPIDMTASGAGVFAGGVDVGVLAGGIELVLHDENIDAVICMAPAFDLMVDQFIQYFPPESKQNLGAVIKDLGPFIAQQMKKLAEGIIGLKEKYSKPIFTVFAHTDVKSKVVGLLIDNGVPIYETPRRAVHALSKLVDYREYVEKVGEDKFVAIC
jgi:acetyltransferase